MKFIAVQGCTFDVQPKVIGDGVWNGTPPTILSVPSIKCKAGSGIFKTPLMITFPPGCVNSSAAPTADPAIVPASIPTTASKNKADNLLVMLEGDSVDVTFKPLTTAVPPVVVPTTMVVSIKTAGQTKAKAT